MFFKGVMEGVFCSSGLILSKEQPSLKRKIKKSFSDFKFIFLVILVLISAHTLLHHPKNSLEDLRDLCVDFLHRFTRYDLTIYLCLRD